MTRTGDLWQGLPLERTQLAWRRTALTAAVNSALVVKLAATTAVPPAAYVLGAVLALIAVGALVWGEASYGPRHRAMLAGRPAARATVLRLLWGASLGAVVAAILAAASTAVS